MNTAATSFLVGLLAAATVGTVALSWQQTDVCAPGYARSHRLPPDEYEPIAREAYRRAGLAWEQRADYRLDHIVPICLGGGWSQSNLQIQTIAAAAEKDRREIAACRAVCAGTLPLDAARGLFRREQKE